MRAVKKVNESFGFISNHIDRIVEKFDSIGSTMQDGRNVVKVVSVDGVVLAVKEFKRITIVNRIVYRFFRKSKAQRAYENADFLLENDVLTPMPVAYVDVYDGLFLRKSYFVSLYVGCKPVEQLFSKPADECRKAVVDFAGFTHRLHKLGAFHGDYSLKNILYIQTPAGYEFCLIDNNRMRFKKYSKRRAMRNLRLISMPLDLYAVMAMEYSKLEKSDAFDMAQGLLFYMSSWKSFLRSKRGVKAFVKRSFAAAYGA